MVLIQSRHEKNLSANIYFVEPFTRLFRVTAAKCPISLVQCRPHHDNEPTEMEVNESYVSGKRYFISVSDMC